VAVALATGAISQEHGLGGEVDGGVAIAFLGDFFIYWWPWLLVMALMICSYDILGGSHSFHGNLSLLKVA